MGRREVAVSGSTIRTLRSEGDFVVFRPDVYLKGDILHDPSYSVVMVEEDGVMTINANKVKGAKRNVRSKNKKGEAGAGERPANRHGDQG